MCNYSSACRLDCQDALACPDVAAAFGPAKIHYGRVRASSWWAKVDANGERIIKSRPKPRLNEQGEKLCSVDGCNEVRMKSGDKCRAHYNEYQAKYRANNQDKFAAYRERYENAN